MATKLFVGNLSFDTTEDELRELFAKSGQVVSCEIVLDKFSGRSRGFGFVQMASADEATKAITDCNGYRLGGRPLTVNEARPREERPRGDFGGGFREGGRGRRY